MMRPKMAVQAAVTGPRYTWLKPNGQAEMTTASHLPVFEGHTFHSRLRTNTLMTSSEAAPKNISGPTKRPNNLGSFASPAKMPLTLVLEPDAGISAERQYVEITLARMTS
jgi:hypothetical protein